MTPALPVMRSGRAKVNINGLRGLGKQRNIVYAGGVGGGKSNGDVRERRWESVGRGDAAGGNWAGRR